MNRMRTLRDDTRGAMMLIAVFMAVFLVGCLWYVIGVGDAALYRDKMQDASDSVAYVSAVYHARGMNILACINLVMAGIVAVLVALRIIVIIITVGEVIAGVLCAIPYTAAVGCPVQQVLDTVRGDLNTLASDYEDFEKEIIPVLHGAQTAVASAVPVLALAESAQYASRYSPTVKFGAAASTTLLHVKLPVEEMKFDAICTKGGKLVGQFVGTLLPKGIDSVVGGMVDMLTSSFPDYFCGDSNDDGQRKQKPCDQQQKRHDDEWNAWVDSCEAHDMGSDCPDDMRSYGGPQRPQDFDKDQCEDDMKDQKAGEKTKTSKDSSDSNNNSGLKVKQDATNGDGDFAVLSVLIGDGDQFKKQDHIVRLPAWGKPATAKESELAKTLDQVGFSRSEFYYEEGTEGCGTMKEEGLWHICWRARLRRIRFGDVNLFDAARQIPGVSDYLKELGADGLVDVAKSVVGDKANVSSIIGQDPDNMIVH